MKRPPIARWPSVFLMINKLDRVSIEDVNPNL